MLDVAVRDEIPQRTTNMTVLLQRNPVEICDTVQELVECLQKVIVNNSRMNLYTAYFLGRAIDGVMESNKYPGMTMEKLSRALDISKATAYKYRRLSKLLTPEEVDELGAVPYTAILELPHIEEQFGEAAVKEIKFRLTTNDFEGARGKSKFDLIVADMAEQRLHFGASLPGEAGGRAALPDSEEAPTMIEVQDAEVVAEDIDSDDDEESEPSGIDSLLAERQKMSSTKLEDKGKTKGERKVQAEIAFAQARTNLTKVRAMYVRLRDEARGMLEKAWQQEDYIIGDDDTNAKYRELLSSLTAEHRRVLELVLDIQKELRNHGESLEAVEMSDGSSAASLLDPAD